MNKKIIVEELNNIDDKVHFIEEIIKKIEILNEEDLNLILKEGIRSLNFSLEDIEE